MNSSSPQNPCVSAGTNGPFCGGNMESWAPKVRVGMSAAPLARGPAPAGWGRDQCFGSKCFGGHLLLLVEQNDGHRVPGVIRWRAVVVQGL